MDDNNEEKRFINQIICLLFVPIVIDAKEYCSALASSKGGTVKNDGHYNVSGYCFIEVSIQTDEIKQKESAISAHWDSEGNYLYPQVGDVYPVLSTSVNDLTPDFYSNVELNKEKYDNYFYDFALNGGENIGIPIENYRLKLKEKGYDIKSSYLLSLDDLNNIVKKGGSI